MRVVAFANHKGGAGETATAINLSKTGCRALLTDLDPQSGATRGMGVRDSRTVFSVLQSNSALTGVILSFVIQFREFASRALRVRGFIPSTVNGPSNLTKAMLALWPQMAPFIRNTVRFSEAPGTGKSPYRHAPRHPVCGDCRLLAVDGEAPPSGAGSDAPPQTVEPRPPTPGTPGTTGRDA